MPDYASTLVAATETHTAPWTDGVHQVKRLTPHGLRHTFASLLLADRRPVTEVAYLMGHKDSSVTLKVYAHFVRTETGAVQALAASILGGGKGE